MTSQARCTLPKYLDAPMRKMSLPSLDSGRLSNNPIHGCESTEGPTGRLVRVIPTPVRIMANSTRAPTTIRAVSVLMAQWAVVVKVCLFCSPRQGGG